jgi:hypothetical protein
LLEKFDLQLQSQPHFCLDETKIEPKPDCNYDRYGLEAKATRGKDATATIHHRANKNGGSKDVTILQ